MAGIVAKSYCDALFALAQEADKTDIYKTQLCFVNDSVKADAKYNAVMRHPKISKDEKKEVLQQVYGEGIEHTLLNFLKLLVDKGRFANLDDITKEFVKSYNLLNNIQVIYVKSASVLSSEEEAKLKESLSKKLSKKVELVVSVDTDLIAGIRIKINDQIIDNSAKSRLERLKKQVVVSEEVR